MSWKKYGGTDKLDNATNMHTDTFTTNTFNIQQYNTNNININLVDITYVQLSNSIYGFGDEIIVLEEDYLSSCENLLSDDNFYHINDLLCIKTDQ